MADEAQQNGFLLPRGFLGLRDFETPIERAVRLKKERDAENARRAAEGLQPFTFFTEGAAPKKDGGLNGVVSAAVDESGNAIVAAITQLDRLAAANPGDP